MRFLFKPVTNYTEVIPGSWIQYRPETVHTVHLFPPFRGHRTTVSSGLCTHQWVLSRAFMGSIFLLLKFCFTHLLIICIIHSQMTCLLQPVKNKNIQRLPSNLKANHFLACATIILCSCGRDGMWWWPMHVNMLFYSPPLTLHTQCPPLLMLHMWRMRMMMAWWYSWYPIGCCSHASVFIQWDADPF